MRKTTEAERQEYIEECRASGKSASAWCREKGIPYTTYGNWVKNNAETNLSETAQKVSWAAVVTPAESSDYQIPQPVAGNQPKIRIKNGSFEIMVEQGLDLDLLRVVLQAVGSACC
jgi:transposase-like protein